MSQYHPNFKRIQNVSSVYLCGNEIIIFGEPEDSEDDAHNCDEMGCSSVQHVLLRGCFRFIKKGYSEDKQEQEARNG